MEKINSQKTHSPARLSDKQTVPSSCERERKGERACGEQEVGVASGSGWNLWVWLLGVVVRRYIDFLILLIPTPLVSVLFLQQHPYFLFIF